MPFDPNFPPHEAELISSQWRAQFNALKTICDTQAALILTLQQQNANLQTQVNAVQDQLNNLVPDTARNPNGQFVNFDPNWSPSGDANSDFIYLRDRITDLYTIEAR